MTKPITPRQRAVLNYIIRFKRDNGGDSPTVREIMRGVGIPSTSSVLYSLNALDRAGLITRAGQRRNDRIAVKGGEWVYREG